MRKFLYYLAEFLTMPLLFAIGIVCLHIFAPLPV